MNRTVVLSSTSPSSSTLRRLLQSMWRQKAKALRCPAEPSLTGKLALVTGGNTGIGLETCIGLAKRGAEIVILARNRAKSEAAIKQIQQINGAVVHFIPLDLGDLTSIPEAIEGIGNLYPNRNIDLLIANAGLWPEGYGESAQGFEIAMAINVLGHHALINSLYKAERFLAGSRVVMLTGDLYFLARNCTNDFRYEGRGGGQAAYCRSKLGNLWWVRHAAKEYAEQGVDVYAVHPGAVASELGSPGNAFVQWIKQRIMIPVELGAQTSLYCATQPDLETGGYYHNVLGLVELPSTDVGADLVRAKAFWQQLDQLSAPYCL